MEIRDYIKDYYFGNIVEFLDPDYDSMIFTIRGDNTLLNVTFSNKADNNEYKVDYTYNKSNKLIDETLRIIKKNTKIDYEFGRKTILCSIKYKYTKTRIEVVRKGICNFDDDKRIHYNYENTNYINHYDYHGNLIYRYGYGALSIDKKSFDYLDVDFKFHSWYRYDEHGNMTARYFNFSDAHHIHTINIMKYNNDNKLLYKVDIVNRSWCRPINDKMLIEYNFYDYNPNGNIKHIRSIYDRTNIFNIFIIYPEHINAVINEVAKIDFENILSEYSHGNTRYKLALDRYYDDNGNIISSQSYE